MINTNTTKRFAFVTELHKNNIETDDKNIFCDFLNNMNSKINSSLFEKDKTLTLEILTDCKSIGECNCVINSLDLEKNEINFTIFNSRTKLIVDKGFFKFPFNHEKKEVLAFKISNFLSLYYGNIHSNSSLKGGYVEFVKKHSSPIDISDFISVHDLIEFINRLDFSVHYQIKNFDSNIQSVLINYSKKEHEILEFAAYLLNRSKTHNVFITTFKNPVINLLIV